MEIVIFLSIVSFALFLVFLPFLLVFFLLTIDYIGMNIIEMWKTGGKSKKKNGRKYTRFIFLACIFELSYKSYVAFCYFL